MSATASSSGVKPLLRLEGATVLIAALALYAHLHFSWLLFTVLLLAPDLSMLGYLAGLRTGAAIYNAVHTYLSPAIVAALSVRYKAALPFALIWFAHIGLDRMLGYGLKYASGFQDTHLGKIGRER